LVDNKVGALDLKKLAVKKWSQLSIFSTQTQLTCCIVRKVTLEIKDFKTGI
jgi:hypothetical protein